MTITTTQTTQYTVEQPGTDAPFEITTTAATDTECAAPDCHHAPAEADHLRLRVSVMRALQHHHVAEVAFCSLECARDFVDNEYLGSHGDAHDAGFDAIHIPLAPIAHVHLTDTDEPVFTAIGESVEAAVDTARDWLINHADYVDPADEAESIENYSITFTTL